MGEYVVRIGETGSMSDRVEVGDRRVGFDSSIRARNERCDILLDFLGEVREYVDGVCVTTDSPWKKDEYRRRAHDC